MYGKDDESLASIEQNLGEILTTDGKTQDNTVSDLKADDFGSILVTVFSGGTSDYDIPVIFFTPENIFRNRIAAFDINFIDPPEQGSNTQETISSRLHNVISSWYQALRMLALVGMLSVLVYVGIRMIISSSASDKAKYKNMIIDWLVAVCLLFFLHYIMLFTIRLTEAITSMIGTVGGGDIFLEVDDGTTIKTNLMGQVRFMAESKDLWIQIPYTILYVMLVAFTIIFAYKYLMRVINMAFLTIIAPLIVLTYPIDKISDGKAQGFTIWLREYIFNALLQPIHLMIYIVLLGTAIVLVKDNPIYPIIALAFIAQAEKLFRKMFNFDKASGGTLPSAGFLAATIGTKGLTQLANRGRGGKSSNNNVKTDNSNKQLGVTKTRKGDDSAFAIDRGNPVMASENSNNGGNNNRSNNMQVEGNHNDPNNVYGNERLYEDGSNYNNATYKLNDADWQDGQEINNQNQPTTEGVLNSDEAQRLAMEQNDSALYGNYGMDNFNPNTVLNGDGDIEGPIDNNIQIDNDNSDNMPINSRQPQIQVPTARIQPQEQNNDEQTEKDKAMKRKYMVKKGLMGAAKVAGVFGKTALKAGGIIAGATTGLAIGAVTGDYSNIVTGAAAGAGAGGYLGHVASKKIGGATGRIKSKASELSYKHDQKKLGYKGAMQKRDDEQYYAQKRAFMKNKEEIAKAKEIAAKMGKEDYKQILSDSYELRAGGIKDDKTIEAALKVKDEGKLGISETVKIAKDTGKYREDMLYGAAGDVVREQLTERFLKKSNNQLTRQQAEANAREYIDYMREMHREKQ